jgi:uncharacterized membrane protein YfhO
LTDRRALLIYAALATATSNGFSLPVFAANGAFLAVRVPAGNVRIVCRYVPPGFQTGLLLSIGSGLAFCVVLWRSRTRTVKSQT